MAAPRYEKMSHEADGDGTCRTEEPNDRERDQPCRQRLNAVVTETHERESRDEAIRAQSERLSLDPPMSLVMVARSA